MMTATRIKLTPAERELVTFLMGAVETTYCSDSPCERPDDQEQLPLSVLPFIDGTSLVLSENADVNGELSWEAMLLAEQCDEAIKDNFERNDQAINKATRRTARSLLKKLTDSGVEPNC